MQRSVIIALLGLAVVACDRSADDASASPPAEQASRAAAAAFTDLSPDAVDELVADKSCVPVDANSPETRSKYGVLPGAVLLSKAQGYDLSELPADKSTKLVFYCGGRKCRAAPTAAKVAAEAGYRDVNVMREGITGWVGAGKKTDKPSG